MCHKDLESGWTAPTCAMMIIMEVAKVHVYRFKSRQSNYFDSIINITPTPILEKIPLLSCLLQKTCVCTVHYTHILHVFLNSILYRRNACTCTVLQNPYILYTHVPYQLQYVHVLYPGLVLWLYNYNTLSCVTIT